MNSPAKSTVASFAHSTTDSSMSFSQSLRSISDQSLLSRLDKLVAREKQTTLSIVLHLGEVDRRDLYLEYGFGSLFDYCVGELRYSRSAAGRRIATARCIRRYPEVLNLLESGDVNLTTVGHIASILDDDNKDLLLEEIRGKTERQVDSIVAKFKPPVAYRDRVKPVRVAVHKSGQGTPDRRKSLIFNSRSGSADRSISGIVKSEEGTGKGTGERHGAAGLRDHGEGEAHGGRAPETYRTDGSGSEMGYVGRSDRRVDTEQRLLIQFLAGEEFMRKLGEVKSLLSNKIPNATFEDVFEALMDEFIERHSPVERDERRAKRMAKKIENGMRGHRKIKIDNKIRNRSKPEKPTAKPVRNNGSSENQSRYIPQRIRDAVYRRDGGKCTYVGRNGKRCDSTHNLQVDHITPFALGGGNTISNLRLLCARHNRLAAEHVYGKELMDRRCQRE